MGSIAFYGNITVTERDMDGNVLHRSRVSNTMTNAGLAAIARWLGPTTLLPTLDPPKYVAFGSSTDPVDRTMTVLVGETFREQMNTQDNSSGSGTGSVVYHVHLQDSENAGNTVGCYGLFGGAASQAADTGTLYAVANEPSPFVKGASTTLSLDWTITASGVV